jgi:hypothetical protein
VAYLLEARIVEPAETAVAMKWSLNTSIAGHWLSNRHVIAATVAYATIRELWTRLVESYSLMSCETGASQRGLEPWNTEAEESTTLEAATKQRV